MGKIDGESCLLNRDYLAMGEAVHRSRPLGFEVECEAGMVGPKAWLNSQQRV